MSNSVNLKIIDRKTTLSLIDFPGFIKTAELAFISQTEGQTSPPVYINMPINGDFAHYKAGYRYGATHFVVKYSGGFWGNVKLNLPVDYGYVIIHSAKTGEPEVIFLDQGAITEYRTAAAGAVASKYASKIDSRVVGLIGTGAQARLQIEALLYVRPNIETVKIWGRNEENVKQYIKTMSINTPNLNVIACGTPQQAIKDVDILITATPSKNPIVKAEWISPGTHITAVGAVAPYIQEHEPEVLGKADLIYADSIEKCSQDGEIHHGLTKGVIKREQITGELGQLILKQIPGRENSGQITFVDLVGLGIQDATAAEYLINKLDTENIKG